MMRMASFADVIKAVARHVEASGHRDILASDEPQEILAGYCCADCPPEQGVSWWVAPVSTIHDLPKALRFKTDNTHKRITFVRDILKMARAPKLYRPTSWERLLHGVPVG